MGKSAEKDYGVQTGKRLVKRYGNTWEMHYVNHH
jgi:hypothetical protein